MSIKMAPFPLIDEDTKAKTVNGLAPVHTLEPRILIPVGKGGEKVLLFLFFLIFSYF